MRGDTTDSDILAAIDALRAQQGYCPSFREIGKAVGISSSAAIDYRLHKLRDAGVVDWVEGKFRTIRVVREVTA